MGITDKKKAINGCLRAPSCTGWLLPAVLSVGAARADVDFEPEITAGISRTDNLTLSTDAQESQTVYRLAPSFTLTQQSTRVISNVAYQIDGYRYRERDDDTVYHQLTGDLQIALDPDNFFIDVGANRSQTPVTPDEPIPSSNLPISRNRVDRDEVFIGPTFQYNLGGDVITSGSYRSSRVRFADPDPTFTSFVRDFDADSLRFSIDNLQRGRGFSWATRYNSEQTDYGAFQPYEFRQASVELGVWTGSHVRIFASGGKESAWDRPFDPSLQYRFWEAGFALQDGERFTAELVAGERTFGTSRRANVNFNFAKGTFSLAYTQRPTTQARDPYRLYRGPLLGVDDEDFLTRVGNAERFLSTRARAAFSFELGRTSLSFSAFDEMREDRIRLDGTPLDDEQQRGASFSVTRHLGVRTDLTFAGRKIDRTFASTGTRVLETASLTGSYSPGMRTRFSLEYGYAREDARDTGVGRDYTARLVSFLATRTF